MKQSNDGTFFHAERVRVEYEDKPEGLVPAHTVIRVLVGRTKDGEYADHTFLIFAPLGTRL